MLLARTSLASVWFGILALFTASDLSPSVVYAQEKSAVPKELELNYEAFDQRPGSGWRKIADEGKYLEAAKLIDLYEREKEGLVEWQRVALRFHAGQMYASADKKELAIDRFKSTVVAKEPPDSPVRWNAYVQATIAFLEKDREKLLKLREEIAAGPKWQGKVPNLDVVDRLIEHFDQPYIVAYRGKAKKSNCAGRKANKPLQQTGSA
jgi:hypothetical protein